MTPRPTYKELEQRVKKLENDPLRLERLKEELQTTRQQFEDIIQSLPDPTFVIDRDKKIVAWNRAIEEMTGLSREKMIGRGDRAYSIPFWGEPRKVLIDLIMDHDRDDIPSYEFIERRGDSLFSEAFLPGFGGGEGMYVWLKASPLYDRHGNIVGAIEAIRNITEHKEAAENLRKSEERFHYMFEQAAVGVALSDTQTGHYVKVNQKYADIVGYSIEELSGLSFTEISHPEDIHEDLQNLEKLTEDKAESFTMNKRFIHKDGSTLWGKITVSPMWKKDEATKLHIAILEDITDKKIAEDAIRDSEKRYRTIMDSFPDPVVTYDIKGNVLYINPAFTRVFGWPFEEVVGKKIDYVPEESWPETQAMLERLQRGESVFGFQTQRYDKNKNIIDIDMSFGTWRDKSGDPVGSVVILRDVTEQKKLQYQLRQAQKMESIGTLAGGIAHDFNNILSGIFGYTQLLQLKIQKDSEMHVYLDPILHAGTRAKELVQQILTFSRQSVNKSIPTDIQIVIKEALKLIEASLPSTITIRQRIQKDCGLIMADHTLIHQIIMNLCTNAYHAMEKTGGELSVALGEFELWAEDWKDRAMNPGKYAKLTVADTGTGMDQGVIDRIFDPYFTTKEEGKGTGLGLAVIHGIVKSHGGYISVDSRPGKGTEFHIFLPVIAAVQETASTAVQMPIQKGSEHILLVDDQEEVLDIERQILEALGYKVTVNNCSIEAVDTFRASPDSFDLVITDMTMPNMTGDKLAGELIKIRPEIPILLCTGLCEQISEEELKSLGIKGVIMKPVVSGELSTMIRKLLDPK
ncbi:MAG: PAS domain S-box protein [Desulfobacterales bacterium]|nr:PAS domain S-box protein [Desulfobacterales bacterium]